MSDASTSDVTAIIVNYNTRELLRPCIDDLRASAVGTRLQTVIVDNTSRDDFANVLHTAILAYRIPQLCARDGRQRRATRATAQSFA